MTNSGAARPRASATSRETARDIPIAAGSAGRFGSDSTPRDGSATVGPYSARRGRLSGLRWPAIRPRRMNRSISTRLTLNLKSSLSRTVASARGSARVRSASTSPSAGRGTKSVRQHQVVAVQQVAPQPLLPLHRVAEVPTAWPAASAGGMAASSRGFLDQGFHRASARPGCRRRRCGPACRGPAACPSRAARPT